MMSPVTTFFQHHTRSPKCCNKKSKENGKEDMQNDKKEVILCSQWHDSLCRKCKRIDKKAPGTNKQLQQSFWMQG